MTDKPAETPEGFLQWFGANYRDVVDFGGDPGWRARAIYKNAMHHARAALAAPVAAPPEPATYAVRHRDGSVFDTGSLDDMQGLCCESAGETVVPLYWGAQVIAAPPEPSKPLFWVRLRSDGCYEGPISDASIEDVRKRSGAWTPLYAGIAPPPAACGISWSGHNVHGDDASIRAVKDALHDAGTVPELKARIAEMQRAQAIAAEPEPLKVGDFVAVNGSGVGRVMLLACGEAYVRWVDIEGVHHGSSVSSRHLTRLEAAALPREAP